MKPKQVIDHSSQLAAGANLFFRSDCVAIDEQNRHINPLFPLITISPCTLPQFSATDVSKNANRNNFQQTIFVIYE